MQGLDLTLKVLGEMPAERATETLLQALNEPAPTVRKKAFDCLLRSKWDSAALRLIAYYGRLDSHQKSRILERHEELIPHLRSILDHGKYDTKCNAIRIISDVGKIKLLHLLIPVFLHIDERVRRRAGRALMEVIENYMTLSGRMQHDKNTALAKAAARSRREISGVFRELLRSYPQHRERIILRGLLALGDNCHRLLMTSFQQGNDRTAADLIQVLQQPESEQWDIFLARMFIYHDELVRRRADFVLKKRGPRGIGKVIRQILNLAGVRSIINVATWWGAENWWKTVYENMDHYDEVHIQDKIFAAIHDSGTEAEYARKCLEKMSRSKSSRVRRMVVTEMNSLDKVDADLLLGFLQDPDEKVQLETTRSVIQSDHPQKDELIIRQLLSPHESVRDLASGVISQYSFKAYMRAFDSLGDRTRNLAASALVKIDGELGDELGEALAATQATTKLKALKIAAMARHDEKLEPLIIALSSDADSHVRATAVIALGRSNSDEAEMVLLNALKDPDERVVANAIEALEYRGKPEYLPAVKRFATSAVPRIRGNVVRFLYRFGDRDYRDLFLEMCDRGDRGTHATAIWLAETLDMPEAAKGLTKIIRGEGEPKVRQRAARALERIRTKDKTHYTKVGGGQ